MFHTDGHVHVHVALFVSAGLGWAISHSSVCYSDLGGGGSVLVGFVVWIDLIDGLIDLVPRLDMLGF